MNNKPTQHKPYESMYCTYLFIIIIIVHQYYSIGPKA